MVIEPYLDYRLHREQHEHGGDDRREIVQAADHSTPVILAMKKKASAANADTESAIMMMSEFLTSRPPS